MASRAPRFTNGAGFPPTLRHSLGCRSPPPTSNLLGAQLLGVGHLTWRPDTGVNLVSHGSGATWPTNIAPRDLRQASPERFLGSWTLGSPAAGRLPPQTLLQDPSSLLPVGCCSKQLQHVWIGQTQVPIQRYRTLLFPPQVQPPYPCFPHTFQFLCQAGLVASPGSNTTGSRGSCAGAGPITPDAPS